MTSSESDSKILQITDAGILPVHTADPEVALERVRTDGAVVLTGLGRTAEAGEEVARTVFGGSVLAVPPAAEVSVNEQTVGRRSPEEALWVHTDGYSYGNESPDYFLLLCSQHSEVGGESILVDAYRMLDELAGSPEGAALVERLETVPVDQTRPGMRQAVTPMISRAASGRRRIKRFYLQRPRTDSPNPDEDAALIDTWDRLCRGAAESAPRFKLMPGEAVIIDNYRVLHGREPYTDHDRLLWRVWIWTDTGYGVPTGRLASDRRYAAASMAAD